MRNTAGARRGSCRGLEVVELDECHAGAMRAHDHVALFAGGVVQHCGQGAHEFGKAHAAAEIFLVSGARCPCHVKARGSDTGEGVQHRLRFACGRICALSSPMPRPCFIT